MQAGMLCLFDNVVIIEYKWQIDNAVIAVNYHIQRRPVEPH